jgi:hypothetical protein
MAVQVIDEIACDWLVAAPNGHVAIARKMAVSQKPVQDAKVPQERSNRGRDALSNPKLLILGSVNQQNPTAAACQRDGRRRTRRAATSDDNLRVAAHFRPG